MTIDIRPTFTLTLTGETVAEPDYYNVGEDATLVISAADGLSANDYTDLGTITVTNFSAPTNGSLEVGEDGSFTYVPDAGFVGIDTFTYYATDDFSGGTASAVVTIDVTHPAPIATPEIYTIAANQTLTESAATGLLLNDLSLSGSALIATNFSDTAHGSLEVGENGSFTYTPDAGYVGLDTFTYYISDGTVGASAVATIDVTDDAPVANADNYALRAGQTLTIDAANGLLVNDSSDNGTLIATNFTDPVHGSLEVGENGSFTYSANAGYIGLDTFTYYISDGALESSAVATIDVVGTAPFANADYYDLAENGTLNISAADGLLANDSDPDGGTIIATNFSDAAHGSLEVGENGSFTYAPDAGYIGTDSFTYYISDGALSSSAVAHITVEAPTAATIIAINPHTYAVGENASLTISAATGLLLNDYANQGSITVTNYSDATHGSLEVGENGSFTYTPDAGFTGVDSFTYYAVDGTASGSATVSIDVTHPAPIATPEIYTVEADHTLTESATTGLLLNDLSLSGSALIATNFSEPTHGSLEVGENGSFTYAPDAGYVGLDTFTYYISDGTVGASAVATIDVTDDAPIANADSYAMRAGQVLTISAANGLLANDSSDNGTLIATNFSNPTHGTLEVGENGSFTYSANAGYVGTDSFTYYISDGVLTSSAVATINVVDTAPVANPDYYFVTAGSTLDVTAARGLLLNDFDPNGDSITATNFSEPLHGSLEVGENGSFTYSANAGYSGTDSFTYYISDGALSSSAVAHIDVVACFCPGTRIATATGQVPVEKLAIGDEVLTLHAGPRRIKWIGTRSYIAPFTRNPQVLPVRIRANAIADGIPARDLFVSPGHALCLNGALVHAARLINGVSITQAAHAEEIQYFHIELDSHEVVFAENCPAETFRDEAFRGQFQNAAEFYASHGKPEAQSPCLPHLAHGFALQALQNTLAARAGLQLAPAAGRLRGYVDQAGPQTCAGWAQDEASPEAPVCLDIFADGQRIGRVLANLYRLDLQEAGLGSGCHGFEFSLPACITGPVDVRRAADGTALALTEAARAA